MRTLPLLALVSLLGLGACGSNDDERFGLRTPGTDDDPVVREIEGSKKVRRGDPTATEVAIIRGWSDTLRAGQIGRASSYFAVPSVVADGANPVRRLGDERAIRSFNRGLPCGAELVDTDRGEDSYVVATFKLTERPGPGSCGTGTGRLVRTAFLIDDHERIVHWLRLPDPVQPSGDTS